MTTKPENVINKERVQMLVDDLRTTNRPQGRYALRSDSGDCCLARACEVYHRETGDGKWRPLHDSTKKELGASGVNSMNPMTFQTTDVRDTDTDHLSLPHAVKDWFGFTSVNPNLT